MDMFDDMSRDYDVRLKIQGVDAIGTKVASVNNASWDVFADVAWIKTIRPILRRRTIAHDEPQKLPLSATDFDHP